MMDNNFKVGDLVKIDGQNRVFEVVDIANDQNELMDGWLIDLSGTMINPKFCKHYEGAKSVLSYL